jgi:hypothetical protein
METPLIFCMNSPVMWISNLLLPRETKNFYCDRINVEKLQKTA